MARKPKQSPEIKPTAEQPTPSEKAMADAGRPNPAMAIKKIVKNDLYRTMYSNYAKVGITQWDLTVVFGQNIELKDEDAAYEEAIAVKFSPQYFKALVASLNATVEQWEATFGKLTSGLGQAPNVADMGKAFENLKDVLSNIPKEQGK